MAKEWEWHSKTWQQYYYRSVNQIFNACCDIAASACLIAAEFPTGDRCCSSPPSLEWNRKWQKSSAKQTIQSDNSLKRKTTQTCREFQPALQLYVQTTQCGLQLGSLVACDSTTIPSTLWYESQVINSEWDSTRLTQMSVPFVCGLQKRLIAKILNWWLGWW